MYFKSKNIQMYYEKYGNGNDIMLILPGWGETRKTFNKIIEYDKNIYTELFPDIVKYIDMGYDITAINTLCSYINAKERVTTGLDTNISTLYSKIYRLLGNNSNKEYKDSYILWDNIKYSYKHNDMVLTKCLNK